MTSGGFRPREPEDRPEPDQALFLLLAVCVVAVVAVVAVLLL